MPFLRAAWLKKAKPEQEDENLSHPPVVAAEETETEPEKLPDIDELLRVIDEKAEEAELNENEIDELAEGSPLNTAEPEVVSGDTEDIHVPESDSDGDTVPEVQEEQQEEGQEGQDEPQPEIEPEPEEEQVQEQLQEPEIESEQEQEQEQEQESEPEIERKPTEKILVDNSVEPEPEPIPEPKPKKDYSGETLDYDFTSGKRYVDLVSTKTDFDRMLDELSSISSDLLSHEVEKFAVKFTGKFQGDFTKAESDAKKYEAFLGGYITNAAMILYDNGYRDAAIKQLEQAKSILEARKKLEDETEAIKSRVEEENDSVDLSDILGLFGD